MSGTTTQLAAGTGVLAGFGTLSIDGTLFNCQDPTYSDTEIQYESATGYDGYHGRTGKIIAAYIAAKVRDNSGMSVSSFAAMTNSEVILTLANGKVVSGYNMCCMNPREVDANTGLFDVRFEGPALSGT